MEKHPCDDNGNPPNAGLPATIQTIVKWNDGVNVLENWDFLDSGCHRDVFEVRHKGLIIEEKLLADTDDHASGSSSTTKSKEMPLLKLYICITISFHGKVFSISIPEWLSLFRVIFKQD